MLLRYFFLYYNFCRVHSTLRVTPAIEVGMPDAAEIERHAGGHQVAAVRRGEGEGALRGVLEDEFARVAGLGGDLVDVVDARAALVLVEEESTAVGVPALEAGGLAGREIGLLAVQLPDEEMLGLGFRLGNPARGLSAGFSELLDDVVVDGIHRREGDAGNLGIWHADAKCFLHADNKLQGINGIQSETVRAEERQIIRNLLPGCTEHQVRDQHFFYLLFQFFRRHRRILTTGTA